jgi:hypothetical protein
MMNFNCNHEKDCPKPDRYGCHVDYIEIYGSEGLVEVFPNDDEPAQFTCLCCDAVATLEASETTKQNRRTSLEDYKQERIM